MFTFHFRLSSKDPYVEGDPDRIMTTGEIYIETENGFFPCISWGDLILSAVSMWMSNTIRMIDPSYRELHMTNSFMDGPYSFEIQKVEKDYVQLKFIRQVSGVEKEEILSLNMAFADYCNALLRLVENMMSDPKFHMWLYPSSIIEVPERVFIEKCASSSLFIDLNAINMVPTPVSVIFHSEREKSGQIC